MQSPESLHQITCAHIIRSLNQKAISIAAYAVTGDIAPNQKAKSNLQIKPTFCLYRYHSTLQTRKWPVQYTKITTHSKRTTGCNESILTAFKTHSLTLPLTFVFCVAERIDVTK